MKKVALLFSGQGSQYIGMGKDLFDSSPVIKKMYRDASSILGYDLTEICFQDNDLINLTKYTQPAIVTTSISMYEAFKAKFNIAPTAIAGFSLGEYSALYAAKVFTFKDIISLIKLRAEAMDDASLNNPGKMAAILGMNRDVLLNLVKDIPNVWVANFNSPVQQVVAGSQDSVNYLCEQAKANGAKRAIVLNVSGAFHTPFMQEAANKVFDELLTMNYAASQIEVIMNCNAQPMDHALLPQLMQKQIVSSVYFEDTIKKMINDYQIETFIEIGPGNVLTGLVKKIDNTKKTINLDKYSDLINLGMEDI